MTDTKRTEVYYAGRQWFVTEYGLETLEPYRYDIAADRLGDLTDGSGEPMAERLRHVGMKTWIDTEDLVSAFAVALQVHEGRYSRLPVGAFHNAVARLRASKARSAVYREMFPPKLGGTDAAEGSKQIFKADDEFSRRYSDQSIFREVQVDWPEDED